MPAMPAMDTVEVIDLANDTAEVSTTVRDGATIVSLVVVEHDADGEAMEEAILHLNHAQVTLLIAALSNARAVLEAEQRRA